MLGLFSLVLMHHLSFVLSTVLLFDQRTGSMFLGSSLAFVTSDQIHSSFDPFQSSPLLQEYPLPHFPLLFQLTFHAFYFQCLVLFASVIHLFSSLLILLVFP